LSISKSIAPPLACAGAIEMGRHRRHLGALALLAGACGGDGEAEPPRTDADPDAAGRAAAAALRGLPYLGGAPAPPGEGTGVLRHDRRRSAPGVNLVTIQLLGRTELIDADGVVLRSWSHPPSLTWEQAELLPDGDLLVVAARGGTRPEGEPVRGIPDDSRALLRLDWDGAPVWERRLLVHHDVALAPGGRLVALAFERVHEPDLHRSIPVRDDRVLLLDPAGAVVEERSLLAVLLGGGAPFELFTVAPDDLGGAPWVDLLHANSVEWMHGPALEIDHPLYAPDHLLVCLRHQDRVVALDWTSGALVWSWGAGALSGPHDAHLLPDGNVLVFDNGLDRRSSGGVEVDPRTGEVVWEYRPGPSAGFFTASKGSIQRLANGNTLLAESDRGRAIEVTPAGEVVWEYRCPYLTPAGNRAAIVRMKRLPAAYVAGIAAARSGAGAPAETAAFDAMVR
jgi:hypothetical protein